ncbi:hypothetical protein J437_LFUL003297, partial [Ladona fulva]
FLFLNIYKALNDHHINACIFYDLSKAFDSINHKFLFSKFSCFGLHGKPLSWITTFLSNRFQRVKYCQNAHNGPHNNSKPLPIISSVPQGSIIGPLLFILFMNDLPPHLASSNPVLYADVTSCLISSNNLDNLIVESNNFIQDMLHWCNSNSLMLNCNKFCVSEYLLSPTEVTITGLFSDLTRAFDIVNHEILLNKMESIGILGVPLKWFKNIP